MLVIYMYACSPPLHKRWVKQTFSSHWLDNPLHQHHFTGFVLLDPAQNKTIFDHNGSKYYTPASNTKIFTLYAALNLLGDTLPTFSYAQREDTLWIKGTADPTFMHPHFADSSLSRFLQQSTVLMYQPQPRVEAALGPGWAWDDYNEYYQVERSDLPLFGNIAYFEYDSTYRKWGILPRYFNNMTLFHPDSELSAYSKVIREATANRFTLADTLSELYWQQEVPYKVDTSLIARLLADTLDMTVGISQHMSGQADWQIYKGWTADTVYRRMMHVSDNFIAEQLLWMCAYQLTDTMQASKAIDYVLDSLLYDLPQRPKWVDGSGLSRYNLFTPQAISKVLLRLYQSTDTERLIHLFPAGGLSGTIENWYEGETGAYVFAKTGTLSNNHNLSGYIRTSSGRVLIFSFMHNHYLLPSSIIKQEMEAMLEELYNKF